MDSRLAEFYDVLDANTPFTVYVHIKFGCTMHDGCQRSFEFPFYIFAMGVLNNVNSQDKRFLMILLSRGLRHRGRQFATKIFSTIHRKILRNSPDEYRGIVPLWMEMTYDVV